MGYRDLFAMIIVPKKLVEYEINHQRKITVHTCNNKENGKQALNESSAKKFIIKLEHDAVILLVNPLSNGIGKLAAFPVAADTSPPLVSEDASVEGEVEEANVLLLLGGVIVAVEVIVAIFLFSKSGLALVFESELECSSFDSPSPSLSPSPSPSRSRSDSDCGC